MPPHHKIPEAGPATGRRAATALASLVAIGAGLGAGPSVAAADTTTTTTSSSSTTPVPAGTTTTASASATGVTTTAGVTSGDPSATGTTSTPTTTSSAPPATTTTTSTTPPVTPADVTTTTTTVTTTTTGTTPQPVATTPAPGTATTPEGKTVTVTGTKTVTTPKGKTHRQHPGRARSRTGAKAGNKARRRHRRHRHNGQPNQPLAPLHRKRVKAKSHHRPKPQSGKAQNTVAITPLGDAAGVTVTSTGSWTSPVMTSPFTQAQLAQYAALVGALTRPPKYLVKIYKEAARHYRLPWQVLAAINYVETGYGRDLRLSSVGAEGWMQFMPGTWAEYGMNVDARGRIVPGAADPWQPRDAIFSAARYLVANGAPRNLPRAVFAYNHAGWYVQEVLSIAERITTRGLHVNGKVKRKIYAMRTTARLLNGLPYVWGGGHAGRWGLVQSGYDCSGFVSAVLHAGGYLKVPSTTQTIPDDSAIKAGPGRYVTIFDRTDGGGLSDDHVIIDIDGQFWESGGGGATGAAHVHRMWRVSPGYLKSFNLVLHPRGL